jgi:hypothetical protein
MCIGLHVKYRYFYQIVMELEFSVQIFKKYKNMKFYENLPSGSRVVSSGLRPRETTRQRDRHNMTKLIVAFRNFVKRKATKKRGMPMTGLAFFFFD